MKHPCVYILASGYHGTLYVGVTTNLVRRIDQHKRNLIAGFTRKYRVHNLVWYEQHPTLDSAIPREKALKEWKRAWKIALIEEANPRWLDLYPTLL